MVARENFKSSAPEGVEILACRIACAKEVDVSKLREITWVAYLGQITIIGGGRAREL